MLITLGLFFYEIYGIKKCHNLIKAGQQIEGQMGIRGQFKERPREVARFINEPFAAGVIYPAVLAAWTFLALQGKEWTFLASQGQEIFKWEAADSFFKWKAAPLFIAPCVFFVGFVCSEAYNLWLGTEKTFVAKLFDCDGKKLDESFFRSHRIGARKSARDWATKKYENVASIQLTDADDVRVTEKIPMEAPKGDCVGQEDQSTECANQAAAENGSSPDEPNDEQANAKESFHQRARESHAEARKLLTAMAVGSLGVLYATLIGKDAPDLADYSNYSKWLALGIAFSMILAAIFGLAAWRADAAWAYEKAEGKKSVEKKCRRFLWIKNWRDEEQRLDKCHCIKKWCDKSQLYLFGVGLVFAAWLTVTIILDSGPPI